MVRGVPQATIVEAEFCICGDEIEDENECPEYWFVQCPRCEDYVEVDGHGETVCANGHRVEAI